MSRFEEKNAAVFGVSFDTVAENAAFAEKFSFPYDLLCDTDRSMGKAYGAHDEAKPDYARRISYVMTAGGPEPVAESANEYDYEHYVEKQIRPVAEAVLPLVDLDWDEVVGNPRQLKLF